MFIPSKIKTAYGTRLASAPSPVVIPRDPVAAALFATKADHAADEALNAGRFVQAERLSHAAFEARCRAEGRRA